MAAHAVSASNNIRKEIWELVNVSSLLQSGKGAPDAISAEEQQQRCLRCQMINDTALVQITVE
jgi:hypothetical protein